MALPRNDLRQVIDSFVLLSPSSGVTKNSGAPRQISKSSPPSPFPILSPPSAPSLPLPSLFFLSFLSPFCPSLPPHVLPFPSILPPIPTVPIPFSPFPLSHPLPFPSILPPIPTVPISFPPSPPSSYNGQGIWGSAIAPPVCPGGGGRQTHYCAIHSPKSANLLKL